MSEGGPALPAAGTVPTWHDLAMTVGRALLPLAAAMLPLGALAGDATPPAPAVAALAVVVRCEACTNETAPGLGLLWLDEGHAMRMAGVESIDWERGTFAMTGDGVAETITGIPLPDSGGWLLAIPVADMPFRLTALLPGFTAPRAAYWPHREAGPFVFDFEPVEDLLARAPAWDPAATSECDVLVPKDAPSPVTFFASDEPRAWLYPAPPAADGTRRWTFQYVRPGGSLLDRVNVLVAGFDEGSAWSFRLPLAAVLGPVSDPLDVGAPGEVESMTADIAGAGAVQLGDCPRAVR